MFLSLVIALAQPRLRWLYLGLAVVLGVIVIGFVDLTPRVGSDFFFSTDDPKLQADARIDKMFESGPQIIVSAESANVQSAPYVEQIRGLTTALTKVKGVSTVRSITSGPNKPEDAWKSPLWTRLLIAPDHKATNLIIELNTDDYDQVVPRVESVVQQHQARDFNLAISGVPFVSEQISRNLLQDLKTFGLAALVVFSLLIIIVFRSLQVLLGALSACAIAAFLTLLAGPILGKEPGLLTPNVSTIIFVLTLSHIMFLAANWTNAAKQEAEEGRGEGEVLRRAIQWTVPGSFWSMTANLLGFLTLLMVAAKPIRQFGISCSIGAVIAFGTAYLVFPSFLRAVSVRHFEQWPGLEKLSGVLGSGRHTWALIAGLVFGLAAIPGLWRLNTDPSLLDYFKPRSGLRTGLDRIDRTGGSVPLKIAVSDTEGQPLNTDEAYKRLWGLQKTLEQDPDVGTVISLPVLIAEAKRPAFSFLFSIEGLLKQMEKPQYGRIANSFVTHDRRVSLFFIRMKESGSS